MTFGVAEPFTVSLTVSVYAGFLLALPIILWQLWLFFAPAFDAAIERRVLELVGFATALGAAGLAFGYWILLPRAVHWLTHYDETQFHDPHPAKDYYSFTSTVLLGHRRRLRAADGRARARPPRGPLFARRSGSTGAWATSSSPSSRSACPGPDPVTTALELLPMWALFEGSIWLAV